MAILRMIRRTQAVTFFLGEPSRDAEADPLLPGASRSGASGGASMTPSTPLPTRQILILLAMRFGEPISFTVIYPFVNQMLEDMHVTDDPKKVGYYAGVIESLFAFTTFLTVVGWGRLSDRIGRKPVLCIGLLGVFLSNVCFGLSQTFPQMILARSLGGALNGNVAVIKSTLGEMTDQSNQGRAFSFLPLSWSLGSIIGPVLGGFLSNPATTFPSIFGNSAFFIKFPYALPCFVASLFPLLGAVAGLLFLEESLTPRKGPITVKREVFLARHLTTIPVEVPSPFGSMTPILRGPESEEEEEIVKPPPFSDLYTRAVAVVLGVYAFLALESVSLDAVLILFCYTRVSLGGLGFTESDIGTALAFSGVCTVGIQLALFPPLQRRLGTTKMYQLLMGMYPLVFAMFPVMSYLARVDAESGRGKDRVWVAMLVFLLIKATANMSYGCNMLAVTAAAPSRRLLGALNGVAQMCSSLMRSIGPLGASSLFAFSVANHVLGGWLIYYTMIALGVVGAGVSLLMREEVMGWREVAKVGTAEEFVEGEERGSGS